MTFRFVLGVLTLLLGLVPAWAGDPPADVRQSAGGIITVCAPSTIAAGVITAGTCNVLGTNGPGGFMPWSETLTIATANVVPNLAHVPAGSVTLVHNGFQIPPEVGATPVSGTIVTFLPAVAGIDLNVGDTVTVIYSFSQAP